MYQITIKDILDVCEGKLIFGSEDISCKEFCIDTRKLNFGDIYVAIKGENFDGNTLYEEALEKGAKACIVQKVDVDESLKEKYPDRAIVMVEDTIKALQKLADFKRSKYDIPVIGVTGSVGKTSTRDMIASVVSQKYKTLKTDGNFNNHIGLPLTVLRLEDHEAMVVEMGMSDFGEISLLTKIARPSIAVITNVGTAHIGNLGSRENILKAKLEILEGLQPGGTLIINNDNDMLHMWNEQNTEVNVKTFGIENSSDYEACNVSFKENGISYDLVSENLKDNIDVPVLSKPFVYNSLAAVCVGDALGIDIDKIKAGIKNVELTKSRMELIKSGEITIINDCYNANFDSMKASIESLAMMKANKKIAVLGDMLELGEYSKDIHSNIGIEVEKNKIDILVTVGEESKNIAKLAEEKGTKKENIYVCNNNEEAIETLNKIKENGDIILVKASHGMKFSEIVEALQK